MNFGIWFHPESIIEKRHQTGKGIKVFSPLAVASSSYLLFFFLTWLDMYRYGTAGLSELVLLPFVSVGLGVVITFVCALVVRIVTHLNRQPQTLQHAVSLVGYSYVGSLVFLLIGIAMNLLFQWNTAVASGATGVLWSCGPLFAAVRKLLNNSAAAVIASSLCGMVALAGWYFIVR